MLTKAAHAIRGDSFAEEAQASPNPSSLQDSVVINVVIDCPPFQVRRERLSRLRR